MISLPLVGKDSSTLRFSQLVSILSTGFIWLVVLLLVLFIRPAEELKDEEEKFKTVQIVLADRPERTHDYENSILKPSELADSGSAESPVIEEISTEAAAPAPQESAPVIETPVPVKPEPVVTQKVESKPEPKPETVKTPVQETPKPVTKTEPVQSTTTANSQPKTDVVETPKPTTTTTKPAQTKQPFDWSMFDDDPLPTQQKTTQKVVSTKTGIEGSAATTSTQTNTPTSSTSTSNKQNTSSSASSTTSSALSNIENAKADTNAKGNTPGSSETATKTPSVNTGKISLSFNGGGARFANSALNIYLSEDAKKLIEQTVKIPITLLIEPDGSVLRSNITVPGSMVNAKVRNEIINAISKWHFDEADEQTKASFNFNIVVQ